MTLVEFLHPLKGAGQRDLCLAVMYFHQRYDGIEETTVEGIRALLKRARIPRAEKMNVAQVLSKSAAMVDSPRKDGNRFVWKLTSTGQETVRGLLNLPSHEVEVENDVVALNSLVDKINDSDVTDYLKEALICLQVNALRATVVFSWSAAIKSIRERVFLCGTRQADAAVKKHDPKRNVTKLDDLVNVKESTLLLAANDLGIFDKNERSVLEECLNLRNKCGHPGKYKLGPKKVSSFLEDLIGIVFT